MGFGIGDYNKGLRLRLGIAKWGLNRVLGLGIGIRDLDCFLRTFDFWSLLTISDFWLLVTFDF